MKAGDFALYYISSRPKSLMHAVKAELHGFDPWPIQRGQPVPDGSFSGAELVLEGEVARDLLGGALYYLFVVSERIRNVLMDIDCGPVQWFPIACTEAGTRNELIYYIFHPLTHLDALPDGIEKVPPLHLTTFDARKIPQGTNCFRLRKNPGRIYFSARVDSALKQIKLVGVKRLITKSE